MGQLAEVMVAAKSLPQAAHGSLPAPLRPQYSFQKTEPEASGEVTTTQAQWLFPCPLINTCVIFLLFCGGMRWEMGTSF